jgi:hypothetical protein
MCIILIFALTKKKKKNENVLISMQQNYFNFTLRL